MSILQYYLCNKRRGFLALLQKSPISSNKIHSHLPISSNEIQGRANSTYLMIYLIFSNKFWISIVFNLKNWDYTIFTNRSTSFNSLRKQKRTSTGTLDIILTTLNHFEYNQIIEFTTWKSKLNMISYSALSKFLEFISMGLILSYSSSISLQLDSRIDNHNYY